MLIYSSRVVAISVTRLALVILGQWQADMSWAYNPMLGVEVSEIGATLIALSIPGAKQTYDHVFFRKSAEGHGSASGYHSKSGASKGTMLSNLRRNHQHAVLESQERQGHYDTEISADGDNHRGSQDRIYVKVDVQVNEGRVV